MSAHLLSGPSFAARPFSSTSRTSEIKRLRLPLARSRAPSAPFATAETLEEDIHPAYKKYRSIFEHNSSQLRQIERDEAHNVILPEPTAKSLVRYVLGCIKFMLIPRPLRYVWYHIWIRLRSIYYPYHRKLVLKGSQLDYFLQQKASKDPKISRSRALRRFHWKVSPWEDTVYRLSLLTAAAWNQASVKAEQVRLKLTRA